MWDEAEKYLKKDKYIGPLIKKHGHCTIRPTKKSQYFIDLVDSITQQQLSYNSALAIFTRLKEKLGGKITPKGILKLENGDLRKCGYSRAKTLYLKDLAKKVKSNKLQVRRLDKLSDEEIEKELINVKGIGKWTAEMFLMFSLARPDIFPADDLGIRNSMKRLLKKELKPPKLAKFAERWKPYRTVASWYIWRNLENR